MYALKDLHFDPRGPEFRKDGPTQSSTHSDGTSDAIMPFRLPKPKCATCGSRHVKGVPCFGMVKAWDASKHPRGQPENKGEFGAGGGSGDSGSAPKLHEPLSAIKPPSITDPLDIAQRTGGFSVSPTDNSQPTTGFMVATQGQSTIIPKITDLSDPGQRATVKAALIQYAKDNADHFASNPHLYIGGWHDTAHGEFVLDSSENVEDATEAATLGAQRNQQSIWDVANQKEVKTGGTGDREQSGGKSEGVQPPAGQRDGRAAGPVGGGSAESGKPDRPPGIHEPLPELIAPHLSATRTMAPLKGHTHNREVANTTNWSATHFASLPPEYQKKILGNVAKASPNKLTPEMMHANLSAVFDHAMSHHWEVPTGGKDADGKWVDGPDETAMKGHDWYKIANDGAQKTADVGGIDLHHAIGVVAAMSPQTDWDSNIAMANFVAGKLKSDAPVSLPDDEVDYRHRQSRASKGDAHDVTIPNGKRLSEMSAGEAAWALYAMASVECLTNGLTTLTGKPKKAQLSMGAQNVAKAVDIYRGADPDQVLSGHKVRSFFNNISDPENVQGKDDVTVDTHMVAAATGYKVTASGGTIKKMFEAGGNTAANVKGAYALFADSIRQVAKEKGVTPNQAQAIIWTHWQTVKGGHHGYREDFPEIKNDVPPKTDKVKAKEAESKARAKTRAAQKKQSVIKMLAMFDGRV